MTFPACPVPPTATVSSSRPLHPLLGSPVAFPERTPVRRGGSTGKIGYFGHTRTDDQGQSKLHAGIDLLAVEGWPIFSAHAGRVTRIGYENPANPNQGYGLRIYLEGGGVETRYAHLSVVSFPPGDEVQAGVVIGLVGRTGNLTPGIPTHLHFEVRVGGALVNPLDWLA